MITHSFKCRRLFVLLFVFILPFASLMGANILKNSDFAQLASNGVPEGWSAFCPKPSGSDGLASGNTSMFSVDTSVMHKGKATLRLKSEQPVRIGLVQNKLDVKPGQKLRFSCWMKGEGVKSSGNSGAWVRLGFSNFTDPEKHKVVYKSSGFLKSMKETFDWEFYEGEATVPADLEMPDLGLFLWHSSGTVWFSSPSVEIVQ